MFPETDESRVHKSYDYAKELYAAYGVDTDEVLKKLAQIPISLHCWQGDDVVGFEEVAALSGGGIQATGNYPGRARTIEELRQDAEKALSLIPGKHRFNLHAMYGDFGGKKVDRDQISYEHFESWVEWAKKNDLGIDFNPTLFAHPKADSGFTLSNADDGIRQFLIDHCIACRKIGEKMGKELGKPVVTNIWIPDGFKDIPVDREKPRAILRDALDAVIKEKINKKYHLDAVESKLFGIGSESYVVGSHEFYLGYAITRGTVLCLDAGHFHPTETIADKISSAMLYVDELLLHVSRGVRWDSDHVIVLNDDTRAIMEEIIRNGYQDRVHIGLDFFDASINRVAAWAIGTRVAVKALLIALLEPTKQLRELEYNEDYTKRLALLEEMKTMPFGAVWEHYCLQQGVPAGPSWLNEVSKYEETVLAAR